MINIASQRLATVVTRNQELPAEGPVCIPLYLDFGADTTYTLDLEMLSAQTRFSMLQTLYVDASSLTGALTITLLGGTNQLIKIAAGMQGFYNILASTPTKLSVVYGGVDTPTGLFVTLINVPIPGVVWSGSGGGGGGTVLKGSGVLDFGNIVDGASAELTFAFAGALTTDAIMPGWPSTLEAGLLGVMFVSAANVLTVRLFNFSGFDLDPASATFRAEIVR